jgi:hypothetical protein
MIVAGIWDCMLFEALSALSTNIAAIFAVISYSLVNR